MADGDGAAGATRAFKEPEHVTVEVAGASFNGELMSFSGALGSESYALLVFVIANDAGWWRFTVRHDVAEQMRRLLAKECVTAQRVEARQASGEWRAKAAVE